VTRASRRLLITAGALVVAGVLVNGGLNFWKNRPDTSVPVAPHHTAGRLWSRPHPPTQSALGPGTYPLRIGARRDGALYVPATLQRDRPLPLVVWLHGHGGSGEVSIERVKADADRAGALVVAPTARRTTWDLVGKPEHHFGSDVAFVDAALAFVFDRFAVDPRRLYLAGHSDGATYALALGLTNGDLFSRVMAFAPEYLTAGGRVGKPSVFIAHGVHDPVHHVETTSRRIGPEVRAAGYALTYEEFEGGHELPTDALHHAFSGL
jgi:predicted esterase